MSATRFQTTSGGALISVEADECSGNVDMPATLSALSEAGELVPGIYPSERRDREHETCEQCCGYEHQALGGTRQDPKNRGAFECQQYEQHRARHSGQASIGENAGRVSNTRRHRLLVVHRSMVHRTHGGPPPGLETFAFGIGQSELARKDVTVMVPLWGSRRMPAWPEPKVLSVVVSIHVLGSDPEAGQTSALSVEPIARK